MRGRLKRHFWRPAYFRELLERLSNGRGGPRAEVLAHLGTASEPRQGGLTGLMEYFGGTPMGGRTREEIVDRLMEQAAEAAALRLDKKAVALIERILSVAGSARVALRNPRALTQERHQAGSPLQVMEARIAALTKLGFDEKAPDLRGALRAQHGILHWLRFRAVVARFGRPVQIAGGGRYDNLLRMLAPDAAHRNCVRARARNARGQAFGSVQRSFVHFAFCGRRKLGPGF